MSAVHRRLLRTSTNCLTRVSSVLCASCQHNHVRKFHLNGGGLPSQAELTSKRYPTLKRGAFATLTDADVSSLGRLVSGRVITEESELDGYNTDWLKTVRGWLVHGSTRPVTQFVSGTGWLVGAFTSNIGRWAGWHNDSNRCLELICNVTLSAIKTMGSCWEWEQLHWDDGQWH